jgi:dihydrofolate reductase
MSMGKVILGATMSVDGFINDRTGSVAALYPDLAEMREMEPMRESIHKTGAVVMGRNSFDMAEDPDSLADNYEYQVPIFVLTHHPLQRKPRENGRISFTFVTDGIESAVAQAKAAAGDKDVTIIGAASTARQCLMAGLADELHIDIMPVLLCAGLRMFDSLDMQAIHMEKLKVVELPGGRMHLEYRIVK